MCNFGLSSACSLALVKGDQEYLHYHYYYYSENRVHVSQKQRIKAMWVTQNDGAVYYRETIRQTWDVSVQFGSEQLRMVSACSGKPTCASARLCYWLNAAPLLVRERLRHRSRRDHTVCCFTVTHSFTRVLRSLY